MMDTENDEKTAAPTIEASELRKIETDRQVCLIRYSPDGNMLFGGGYDAKIRRWDLTTEEPQPLEPLIGHHGWVQSMAFLPDGETLVSVDSWGQLCAWSVHDPVPVGGFTIWRSAKTVLFWRRLGVTALYDFGRPTMVH